MIAALLWSLWVGIGLSATGPPAARADAFAADAVILHTAVTITPDFTQHTIAAETSIRFRSQRDALTEIRFSANAMTIDRAAVGGQALRFSKTATEWVIALAMPLARLHTDTLTIAYHGAPARGLIFGRQSVYTGYFTCDWMFCSQDRPGDKAAIDLTLRLPSGMTSIGSGTHSIAAAGPGIEAHVWRESRPYSSYLYGFAAGVFHLASRRQGRLELLSASEEASPERLEALFAATAPMVRFFEEKAGVRFPHSRYAQLHVPGSAAQEAAGFSVIGDASVAPILQDPQEDWVIAHELAHQWWGNLVTCRNWDEFWLNEGITTFMVAAWKEYRWGRPAYDREMALARRRMDTASSAGLNVTLTFPGPYPSLALRRAITYSKGALFMDRLRRELGDQTFWRGLRAFTRGFAGASVDSRDFQRVFERESRRDLTPLFTEWVY